MLAQLAQRARPALRASLDYAVATAPEDAILLADGVFLFRPELDDLWDFRIFVDIDLDLVVERGTERDLAWMQSRKAAAGPYLARYLPSEQIYVDAVDPLARADVIVDNNDIAHPRLVVADNGRRGC